MSFHAQQIYRHQSLIIIMGLYSTQAPENIFQRQHAHKRFPSGVTFKSEGRTRSKCGLSNHKARPNTAQQYARFVHL